MLISLTYPIKCYQEFAATYPILYNKLYKNAIKKAKKSCPKILQKHTLIFGVWNFF